MKKRILVAGGTGNLGTRIVDALLKKGAEVRMIVRAGTDPKRVQSFKDRGATVIEADMMSVEEVTAACEGVTCVVSALQGLHDVIVDTQKVLLDAAVAAGVPRFIPSDFSSDFNHLPPGENRNFDLRREFHQHLDKAHIKATSVFNGAFSEILTNGTPILNPKEKSIGYWGDKAGWRMDFTTIDDTAAFTAEVALDDSTPKALQIASFQVSPNELAAMAKEAAGQNFKLIPMGSLEEFSKQIKKQRAQNSAGENELFPAWQGMQYMHGMFSTQHEALDNNRYPDLKWSSAKDFIKSIV